MLMFVSRAKSSVSKSKLLFYNDDLLHKNFRYSDLINSVQTNTDPEEGLKLWKIWRSSVGQNLTDIYDKLVQVTNKGKFSVFLNTSKLVSSCNIEWL